jgi:hypothetical protein
MSYHNAPVTFDPTIGLSANGVKLPTSVLGSGVPAGGSTGQALVKLSNTDGDVGYGTIGTPGDATGVAKGVRGLDCHGPGVGACCRSRQWRRVAGVADDKPVRPVGSNFQ